MVKKSDKSLNKRESLRESLVLAAERAIARGGLRELRARDLAEEVGCALGAIYTAFPDLDAIVVAVHARTLADLEAQLSRADPPAANDAIARLVALATAYLDFAAANPMRWRAIFSHQLPPGRTIPDSYRNDQQRLFGHIEAPLRDLLPHVDDARRALLARTLFSAVHGIVLLGLEEKLQPIPLSALREQAVLIVTAIGRGMAGEDRPV